MGAKAVLVLLQVPSGPRSVLDGDDVDSGEHSMGQASGDRRDRQLQAAGAPR